MTIRKIGILTKPEQAEVVRVASELIDWCRERGIDVSLPTELATRVDRQECGVSDEKLASGPELLVVIGGDGTLLAAARLLGGRPVPILAINHGGLGFLTAVMLPELYPELEKVLAGEFATDRRVMLDARLLRGSDVVAAQRALNDVVINKGTLARIIELETYVNDQHVSTFRADGLIIATPTGSTAYSLAAGGPILEPGLEAIVITPLCPHALSQRPLVIPSTQALELAVGSRNREGLAVVDGQVRKRLATGDRLKVTSADSPFLLLRVGLRSYYTRLRKMLGWSETPRYARGSGKGNVS
ncbi:MAG: NAD(+)/NADH kinase [Planctomycetota bacterium]|nr:NAD(+)/NADH kinase [Planctomycetota bacterium]